MLGKVSACGGGTLCYEPYHHSAFDQFLKVQVIVVITAGVFLLACCGHLGTLRSSPCRGRKRPVHVSVLLCLIIGMWDKRKDMDSTWVCLFRRA